MIYKKRGIDYANNVQKDDIVSLPLSAVGLDEEKDNTPGHYTFQHSNGWCIIAEVVEDYFSWCEDFIAIHTKHGTVFGNYNSALYSDNNESLIEFIKEYPPVSFDPAEI